MAEARSAKAKPRVGFLGGAVPARGLGERCKFWCILGSSGELSCSPAVRPGSY